MLPCNGRIFDIAVSLMLPLRACQARNLAAATQNNVARLGAATPGVVRVAVAASAHAVAASCPARRFDSTDLKMTICSPTRRVCWSGGAARVRRGPRHRFLRGRLLRQVLRHDGWRFIVPMAMNMSMTFGSWASVLALHPSRTVHSYWLLLTCPCSNRTWAMVR